MTSNKYNSIDEYIAGFPQHTQQVLEQIRTAIKKAVPEAEETISYAIPAFNLRGRYLIYFAGYTNHIGLYPVPRKNEAFKEKLADFKGGVGTAQFPLNKPIPLDLIIEIVQFRVREVAEKNGKKR